MPIPSPRGGESKSKFVSRCVSFLAGQEGYDGNQTAAICYQKYRDKDKTDEQIIKEVTMTTKIQEITEDDPVRAQTDRFAGTGDIAAPEGLVAGQPTEFDTEERVGHENPNANESDLDDILPVK